MRKILLTQGKFAIVDDKDFEWLNQWKWSASKSHNTFYAQRHTGKSRRTILMHRQILNVPSGFETDHRNSNGLDNRRCNIRRCTTAQNHQNEQPIRGGTSKYKGVTYHKNYRDKKYTAHIKHKGEKFYLGCFGTEIEAAKAYDTKAKELFGEFARPNFIPESDLPTYGQMVKWQREGLADYS
ncbi:hypothetical protein LCGC14_1317060 [marine sediment metagenome]|uniref:AP2/ERF domain-containing protein n=1 Tax=marine sediment metagenome TaxID=412755 RepID=A0A0F9KKM5_9ZZZZ